MACAACVALHLNGDEKQLCERMRKFIKHLPGKVLGTASSSSGTTNVREVGWALPPAVEERLRVAVTYDSSGMWPS
jgi:hypothetical protein